jgi:hypothetical protein
VEIKGVLSRNAMNLKVDESNVGNRFVWQDKEERKHEEKDGIVLL